MRVEVRPTPALLLAIWNLMFPELATRKLNSNLKGLTFQSPLFITSDEIAVVPVQNADKAYPDNVPAPP